MRKSLLALGFVAAFAVPALAPALAQVSPRVTDEAQSYSDTYGVDVTTTQSIAPNGAGDSSSVDGQGSKQRGDQATTFGANGR